MKKIKFYHFIPAITFFCITFYLFTLPGAEIPQIDWADGIQLDKFVHIGLFFFLVIGFSYPFNKSTIIKATRLKWFLCFAVVGILYGIAIEFIQKYYVVNRSFSLLDMAADAIGCIAGYYCVRRFFVSKI